MFKKNLLQHISMGKTKGKDPSCDSTVVKDKSKTKAFSSITFRKKKKIEIGIVDSVQEKENADVDQIPRSSDVDMTVVNKVEVKNQVHISPTQPSKRPIVDVNDCFTAVDECVASFPTVLASEVVQETLFTAEIIVENENTSYVVSEPTQHHLDLIELNQIDVGECGDLVKFVESVEDLATTSTSIFRVIFSLLGDFGDIADRNFALLLNFAPSIVQPYLSQVQPFVKDGALLVEIFMIFCLICLEVVVEVVSVFWKLIRPHRPDLLMYTIVGFVICFFGGIFYNTVSAVEAFGVIGYGEILKCLKHVQEDLKNAWEVSESSKNLTDIAQHDNRPLEKSETDSQKVGNMFIIQRVMSMLSVVNPQRFMEAMKGIGAGLMTVIVTLRSKRMKTITFGNAISSNLEFFVEIILRSILPTNFQQWKPYLTPMLSKLIAIGIAWKLSRIIAAVHSAWRGSSICSKYLLDYLEYFSYLKPAHRAKLRLEIILAGVLAITGIWFQFSMRLTLPFPLNAIMLPLTIVESILVWTINQTTSVVFHGLSTSTIGVSLPVE